MPNILLIQPPIQDFYLTQKRTIPYGLISIAANLKKMGFKVELLDALATPKSKIIAAPPEMDYLSAYYGRQDQSPFCLFHQYRHFGYSFEHIGKLARESDAFLVGIASLFTPYADMSLKTAEIVKNNLPHCKTVLGGHHPTGLPESVISHPAIDYLIRGEGETSMPLLATCLQEGRQPQDIPGLCYRKNDGTLKITDPMTVTQLDELPIPALQLLKWKYYRRGAKSGYTIVASRGCPFNCSYCAMGKSSGAIYRRRSIKSVIAEMDTVIRHHDCDFFNFEDENLSNNKQWFRSLLKEIILNFGENDLELRAMNGLFPPSLDGDLVALMKKSGFKTLNLSLGTTSGSQLKRFNRPDVRASFDGVVSLAGKHGMDCVGYIIVGAPFQDPQQSVDDLVYLFKKDVLAGVSVFYPAPGSADFRQCQNLKLLPEKESLYRSSALPLDHTSKRRDTVTLLRLGRIANFMKHLADQGHTLPKPEPCNKSCIDLSSGRLETGKTFLKWFLYDGNIRGVDGAGQVYEHAVSIDLTLKFIQGIKSCATIL